MMGSEALVRGAIYAGVRFYSGYPTTPATEIAEYMAQLLPKVGGIFVQAEDELAAINMAIGASVAGWKAMVATSGPGFSLMQEGIGYAVNSEIPLGYSRCPEGWLIYGATNTSISTGCYAG